MRRSVISAVAAALVLAACGGGSDGGAVPAAEAPAAEVAAPTETAPPADGSGLDPRPLALANGSTVDFNSLLGQDVLFWFWAPW